MPARISSPCFRKNLVGFLDDVLVLAGENRRQQLDDRDLRAEPAPDGAELEADDAAADDDEVLRDFGDLERADVREHSLLVELEERELDWHGARGDDDVLRRVRRHGVRRSPATSTTFPARSVPRPFAQVTLFFRKRNSIPLVFCADDFVLPLEHRREVELRRSPMLMPCAAACSRANS